MKERNSDLKIVLEDLGFPEAAYKVYMFILKKGKAGISELQQTKSLSIDETKNGLKWLRKNCIVLREIDLNQIEYVIPLNPRIVSRALYSRFLWTYYPAEEWPPHKLKDLTHYWNTCCLFSDVTAPYYQSLPKAKMNQGLRMIPEEDLPASLSLSISNSVYEILGTTIPPWTPKIELIWETLKERISHGIKYRRLADELTLVAFGYSINLRDVSQIGVNLRVLEHKDFDEKFFVIDNEEAFVFFPGNPGEDFKLEGMRISMKPLVQMYKDTFERLWSKAIPGMKVIDYLCSIKKDFVSRCAENLTSEERKIIDGLFDYGKFFLPDYSSLSLSRAKTVLNSLAEKGCVIPFFDSETGFIPNLVPQVRKFMEVSRSAE